MFESSEWAAIEDAKRISAQTAQTKLTESDSEKRS